MTKMFLLWCRKLIISNCGFSVTVKFNTCKLGEIRIYRSNCVKGTIVNVTWQSTSHLKGKIQRGYSV